MDFGLQAELAGRLLLAAVLGAIIGAEREFHEHPAGMRTHLLVSMGCALFTVLSIYGFATSYPGLSTVDPSRVAAQIVTGMGFIGAGAILKYGTSIRGLTTAASLWATAAIGVSAGTGQWVLALVGAALVLVSLWPLNRLSRAIRRRHREDVRVRVFVPSLDSLAAISAALAKQHIQIDGVRTHRRDDRHELELALRLPKGVRPDEVIATVNAIRGADIIETERAVE